MDDSWVNSSVLLLLVLSNCKHFSEKVESSSQGHQWKVLLHALITWSLLYQGSLVNLLVVWTAYHENFSTSSDTSWYFTASALCFSINFSFGRESFPLTTALMNAPCPQILQIDVSRIQASLCCISTIERRTMAKHFVRMLRLTCCAMFILRVQGKDKYLHLFHSA